MTTLDFNNAECHALPVDSVLRDLKVDAAAGLPDSEARLRLEQAGPNELTGRTGRSAAAILFEQFKNPLIWLLLGAAVASIVVGEIVEVVAILAIVVLNAALGFFQDFKAETALASLRKLSEPNATVLRNGEWIRIPAPDVTLGDIIRLEAGNRVTADGRVIESAHLQIDEASLTGESMPVTKQTEELPRDTSLADRLNCVYTGTTVDSGRGTAVVVAVGMATELGRIAGMLQGVTRDATPLQGRLAKLSLQLTWAGVALVAVIVVAGLLAGLGIRSVIMTALSMAVAVIPEGLPAAVTVVLALGTRRMLERNALIRRLSAIESLGTVTVICTDKTGTLTLGRMEVSTVMLPADDVENVNTGELSEGDLKKIRTLLAIASLCNDAGDLDNNGNNAAGDATEEAIIAAARNAGVDLAEVRGRFPRIDELAFDSIRKRMSTVHRAAAVPDDHPLAALLRSEGSHESVTLVCTKGSVEGVLSECRASWTDAGVEPINESSHKMWLAKHDTLAKNGARVLAVAADVRQQTDGAIDSDTIEHNLIMLGLLGLSDPPRMEARESIAQCHRAGIRPVMMTGDHPLTAKSIGEQIGIRQDGEPPTGAALSKLNDQEFSELVARTSIFARVTPEDKLRIVRALQDRGESVAMTGDGVNDAPALQQARIGIAMGRTGTDVAKDAADVVLLDDNFASIVAAIAEGRIIFGNILRFLKFLLASNSGELWVMALGLALGMPLPLLPLQILWINLVTDGLPALGLAFERSDSHAMDRPPRSSAEPLLNRSMILDILWIGFLMGIVSLAAGGTWNAPAPEDEARWRTVIFSVLTLSQLGNALALRSSTEPLWRLGFFSNPLLFVSVTATCALQLAVVYVPILQQTFGTTSLGLRDLILCPLLGSVVYVVLELRKVFAPRLSSLASNQGPHVP